MSETLYYIFCVILSIAVLTGISLMSKVKTAVAGNLLSAFSILLGIVITLYYKEIFSVWTIFTFMLIGVLVGSALARGVKMIQMPQLVALLNGVGGRSEEHTSELQSRPHLVCRLLLEKKNQTTHAYL